MSTARFGTITRALRKNPPSRALKQELSLFWSCLAGDFALFSVFVINQIGFKFSMFLLMFSQRTPISHKVIEKRRRDRINRCLNELGKTVPMALAKQV